MELGISKVYLRHFVKNIDSRYVICIGGRRSGKSFATLKFLHFLLSGKPKKLMIIAATFPAIQLVIEDFQNATGLIVQGSLLYGYSCLMANGSLIQFRAFDRAEKVQGTTADYLYFEEFLNIPEEVIRTAMMSCKGQMYFCANPTKKVKLLDDIINEDKSNYLKTTYLDNPYLTEAQRVEFDNIKLRSLQPNATKYDIFQAKVYCDGEFGDLVGKAFDNIEYTDFKTFTDVPTQEIIVTDLAFGGTDKTAICGFKLYNSKMYIHTYKYKQGTLNPKELAMDLIDCGFNCYTPIYADYGGVGRQILDTIITADGGRWSEEELMRGFSIYNVTKSGIMESLMSLMALDAIVVDDSNEDVRLEFEQTTLDVNHNIKNKNDHAVACARYAINLFHKMGINNN